LFIIFSPQHPEAITTILSPLSAYLSPPLLQMRENIVYSTVISFSRDGIIAVRRVRKPSLIYQPPPSKAGLEDNNRDKLRKGRGKI